MVVILGLYRYMPVYDVQPIYTSRQAIAQRLVASNIQDFLVRLMIISQIMPDHGTGEIAVVLQGNLIKIHFIFGYDDSIGFLERVSHLQVGHIVQIASQ